MLTYVISWEQRKLENITSLITKGTTPKDKSGNGEVNFIKVENIDPSSGIISSCSRISLEEHEGYLKRSQLKENDILFSIAGTLGRTSVVNKGILPANTNQALAILRVSEGDISYLVTVLSGRAVSDFIKKNPTVGAQPNLSLEQVSNLEIPYPSIEEQQKIGDYFRNLDDLITLHQREGGQHDHVSCREFMYNALPLFFGCDTVQTDEVTENMTVGEVKNMAAFGDFGRLLFPVDKTVSDDMTLKDVSSSSTYTWYNYIKPEKTVEIVNHLKNAAESGQQIFYNIYTEEEMQADSSLRDTGLFFFKGEDNAKFAVCNAGGGFAYVGAMHDSFPHALEISKMGYNAFALIYRPDAPYDDLARAIEFIHDNADTLKVDPDDYSLWGGSAGARMAATLGNADYLQQLTGRTDIGQAGAVIMQYTGYTYTSKADAPTYVCVGTSDGIANWKTMQNRLNTLESYGIPTEFHAYEGLPHGFGLGTGTVAEGWIYDAVNFWEEQF